MCRCYAFHGEVLTLTFLACPPFKSSGLSWFFLGRPSRFDRANQRGPPISLAVGGKMLASMADYYGPNQRRKMSLLPIKDVVIDAAGLDAPYVYFSLRARYCPSTFQKKSSVTPTSLNPPCVRPIANAPITPHLPSSTSPLRTMVSSLPAFPRS